MSRRRMTGFTLIEVMVALAVVAIALPALLFTLYQQSDGVEYLRDKSLAQIIAANRLTEVRLSSRARSSLLQGTELGTSELAGRDWFWRVASEATEVPQFFRIEVSVGLGDDPEGQALHTLVAFMSADLAQDPDPAFQDAGEQDDSVEDQPEETPDTGTDLEAQQGGSSDD